MIHEESTFILDGVTSSLRMKSGAGNTTLAVLAVIRHRKTSKRKGPPSCGNGFDTAYLPFAKGHVIALELGGSDNQYNVVPQFEDWQGKANGAWRQMEIELSAKQFAGHTMLVEMKYERAGIEEDNDTALSGFQADRFRDWTDPRIPSSFHVRAWKSATGLHAIDDDGKFDAAVVALNKGVTSYSKVFDLGVAMPEPDRGMYVNQAALTVAQSQYGSLKRSESFVSFMLEPGVMAKVRTQVGKTQGVRATEAQGMQAFPIMFAFQKGVSEPKIRKKILARKKIGVESAPDDEIFKKRVADTDLEGPLKKKVKTTR